MNLSEVFDTIDHVWPKTSWVGFWLKQCQTSFEWFKEFFQGLPRSSKICPCSLSLQYLFKRFVWSNCVSWGVLLRRWCRSYCLWQRSKLFDEKTVKHNIAKLISGITIIVLFSQEKPLQCKEIQKYTA